MLFNTLSYAAFFGFVFVVSWLLVDRRWALFLPCAALLGYASAHPSRLSLLASGIALAASLTFTLRSAPGERPARSASALVTGLCLALFAGVTLHETGRDPLTFGLIALGVPLPSSVFVTALGLLAAGLLSFQLILTRKVRLLFLLGASYVFYAHWDYRFLPLIWASSTGDWLLGNAIARAQEPRKRKMWLAGTVALNLGVLSVFKYFNFGVDSLQSALFALGFEAPEIALQIALPIGISFFTFESMSYVIDIYRRQIEPQKSYVEYLSFVAFFPHLVAGPIVRPRDLLPQLAGPARFSRREGSEGLWLIALGLLKKVAIGDYLAINLVDRVFDAPAQYSSLECYAAVLGYAVQIYCDFSGYTDIAIGSALLLGVRFPKNFDAPYKASNIAEFWRRWHISLSTWLRDYLYIPLGGNRKGRGRTLVNLMITMLLGGLWHGASWTFVVWGGIHGVALAVTRVFQERFGSPRVGFYTRALGTLFTFHVVCAAWIFFRAESFPKAALYFDRLGELSGHHQNLPAPLLAILALGLISHFVPERWYEKARDSFIELPALGQGVALFLAALVLRQMASAEAVPFVYFQF